MEDAIRIPADVDFAELCLHCDPGTGVLSFSPAPLRKLCVFNNLDAYAVLTDEDKSMNLISRWYFAHLLGGGAQDEVLQNVLEEMGLSRGIVQTSSASAAVRGLPGSPPSVRTTSLK